MTGPARFRRALLAWYDQNRRDLPWRRTRDPWAIHVSEIMLQQTHVAAVLPYYDRFLARYPNPAVLAAAPEQDVLAAWAGLGYYSRARNLQASARAIAAAGRYPRTLDEIRALPGIGEYTAAAIGSIAFGQPHPAIDGNVLRVLARFTAERGDIRASEPRQRIERAARHMLDPRRPGDFNQAMMELGATVCLPRDPCCSACPVAAWCEARAAGVERELPLKTPKGPPSEARRELILVRRRGAILLRQLPADSKRLRGFWELPEPAHAPAIRILRKAGQFRHTIVSTNHRCQVLLGALPRGPIPAGCSWIEDAALDSLPVSTMTRKALAVAAREAGVT